MHLINNLRWRYATKIFNPLKKVTSQDLEKIMEAIQLSVSSFGLQLYKVLIIEDMELRTKLQSVSWNQRQITEASHLLIFCNYTEVKSEQVDQYLELITSTQQVSYADLKKYGDFVKNKIHEMSKSDQGNWTAKQTYLALGNLLTACAELKIDACPMEGFEPAAYNEILQLPAHHLNAAVIATIGYRADIDPAQHKQKVRKPLNKLFEVR